VISERPMARSKRLTESARRGWGSVCQVPTDDTSSNVRAGRWP